jgi:hypothetical protein
MLDSRPPPPRAGGKDVPVSGLGFSGLGFI